MIETQLKPTCLVQLSSRHLAIATGFLNEPSSLEVYNIYTGKLQRGSPLKGHSDMIDSMKVVHAGDITQGIDKHEESQTRVQKKKSRNPYISYLLTVSRDNKMILWKLFNGRPMARDHAFELFRYHEERMRVRDY